jgi:putative transposase
MTADYLVKAIEAMGAKAVIPSIKSRKIQRDYDKVLYKERNRIERFFSKLKYFRRVATRYDKLDLTYGSFVCLAAICIWLK